MDYLSSRFTVGLPGLSTLMITVGFPQHETSGLFPCPNVRVRRVMSEWDHGGTARLTENGSSVLLLEPQSFQPRPDKASDQRPPAMFITGAISAPLTIPPWDGPLVKEANLICSLCPSLAISNVQDEQH